MSEKLSIRRDNPLVRIPRAWLNDMFPIQEEIIPLIREIDGDKIIISINKGEQTNDRHRKDKKAD